jgi:tetratricopeptide (TPR) repeat protein
MGVNSVNMTSLTIHQLRLRLLQNFMCKVELGWFRPGLVWCLLLALICGMPVGSAADTNAVATAAVPDDAAASNDTLRAYLQLQEQIHETQIAIERAVRESELAALQNAVSLSNRLQAVEKTVDMQRTHELEIVRAMMIIAGVFVVVGVFALLLTAYFHWRTVSRLSEIIAALPFSRGLGAASSMAGLGVGDNQPLLEQTNNRLLGALERLEKRILEIERGGGSHLTNGKTAGGADENKFDVKAGVAESLPGNSVTPSAEAALPPHAGQVVILLGKGHALLSQDQPERAIAYFDEALVLDPNHAEILVKKGDALEKLRRSQEAIECYDRAIALDGSMTIAHLHKGGLLNRLERFDEAMQCYELALRTQEKQRAA